MFPLKGYGFWNGFGLKTDIDFTHFGLESGNTGVVYQYICRLNPKWIRKKKSSMRIRNGF